MVAGVGGTVGFWASAWRLRIGSKTDRPVSSEFEKTKSAQNRLEIGSKSARNRLKIGSKSAQNRLEIGSKSAQIGSKSAQNRLKIGSNRLRIGSKSAQNLESAQNRLKIGSNRLKIGSRNRLKIGSKSDPKSDPHSGVGHRRVLGVWALSPVGGPRWSRRVACGSD